MNSVNINNCNKQEKNKQACNNECGEFSEEKVSLKFAYCKSVNKKPSCNVNDLSVAEKQFNELIKNAVLVNEGED